MGNKKGKAVSKPNSFNNEKNAEEARLMYQDRLDGMTFRAIAAKHNCSIRKVQSRLNTYVPQLLEGPATVYRNAEVGKLDELEEKLWEVLDKDHLMISHGKVMKTEDETGELVPVKDDAPRMAAIDRLLKVADRRAKLLGLDMPAKTELNVTSDIEDDELIQTLKSLRDKKQQEEQEITGETNVIELPAEDVTEVSPEENSEN